MCNILFRDRALVETSKPRRWPTVTKRNLAWIILSLLSLVGIFGALWSALGTSRIVLGQADLQTRIDKILPKTAKDVTVERATIALADDKMMLRVEAEGRKLGQPFTIVASARGRPRYDPDRSALLFEPEVVTVENITIRGGSVAEKVEGAAGRLKGRLGETLKDGASKIDAGAAVIAEQGIKAYLATYPIYRLKDDAKGLVLRTLLRAIAIENNTLVVTVSLWGLTLSAALWALLLLGVAIFAVQLIRHPRWGLSPAFG
jgi:hypothetical protein